MGSKRIKPGDMWPDTAFGTAIVEYKDGYLGIREARVAWLRLPSWGYSYDCSWDQARWGQRVLVYHGHRGFFIRWRFTHHL